MKKKILLLGLIVVILAVWSIGYYAKATTGYVNLSWNANADENVAGYKIYYGKDKRTDKCPKGGYEKVVDAGNQTLFKIEGLEKKATYYFSITSYSNDKKESCFSDEVSKKVEVVKAPFLDKIINKFKLLQFWKK